MACVPPRLRLALVLLLALSAACYAPSAARRSSRMIQDAWDTEARGSSVVWVGPAKTVWAVVDFAVHALVPIHYDGYFLVDRREPREKWFRAYDGPMRPIAEVAILCNADRATSVYQIRGRDEDGSRPARHERWHFPQCIEALEGRYELVVNYYSRTTHASPQETATRTAESTSPSVAEWVAEPGGIYVLRPVLGRPRAAPGDVPNFFHAAPRSQSLGTTTYQLQVSTWSVRIDRVPSWEYIEAPVLEHRERWRRFEQRRW